MVSTNFFCCKNIYPYEYLDEWKKFNEATLPEKEELYRNLNMRDIFQI